MLRRLSRTSLRSISLFNLSKRYLNIHEYQGAELMRQYGINVPPGVAVTALDQLGSAVDKMKDASDEVVLKSQILAGGRGLGTFKNGLKGGVHICKAQEAKSLASKMLNEILVTKQTGPQGKPVSVLYVAKKMQLKNEKYFAILLDRESNGPLLIGCSEGGTSIEDLAEKFPEKIIKVPVDVIQGITKRESMAMVDGLKVSGSQEAAAKQIEALYKLFMEKDCTMVEVNPLAENENGELIAADAKLGFDDNAAFRQKTLFDLKDLSQQDPREVAAGKHDLNYIGLDGNIGCLVNGAGLAMATMDIIKLNGGSPANFLDVGGSATEGQVVEAFKILTADPQVKAILVNIFGGIMKCDVIAKGIVKAAETVRLSVPLVVRLEGTNVEEGKQILKASDMTIITANDLDDAASKAVASIS